ncbi:MAG: DUF4136 domain-containing protein [Pseudomonadota bacterium]
MRLVNILGGVGLALGLAACAQNIKSDVARFHQLQTVPQGATFAIVPQNDERIGSLEFQQYASLVRAKMVQQGFTPVNAGNASDLVVSLDYGVSDSDQVIRSRPGFVGGAGFGFGRGFHPFYGVGGGFGPGGFGGPDVYSYAVYTRNVGIQVYRPSLADDKPNTVVFEGRVESVGRDKRLPEVMPYLVEALFTDFPGESGVTSKVKVKVPRS